MKAPHHAGRYHAASKRMRDRANADPHTTCWRDGLTLDEHPGWQSWTCGHVDDLELYRHNPSPYAMTIDGRLCAPEASRCNYSAGAGKGNERNPHSERI